MGSIFIGKKISQCRILFPIKISFKNENEINHFQTNKNEENSLLADPHLKRYGWVFFRQKKSNPRWKVRDAKGRESNLSGEASRLNSVQGYDEQKLYKNYTELTDRAKLSIQMRNYIWQSSERKESNPVFAWNIFFLLFWGGEK